MSDFQRSVAFFEGLGWKKSDKSMEGLALFPLGGMVLALHPRHELAEDATLSYEPSGFAGLTISHNTRSEAEVDEILQLVVSLGGTLVKPAQKVYWGGYSGYFKDPDGFLFEVAHNPFWGFNANDDIDL